MVAERPPEFVEFQMCFSKVQYNSVYSQSQWHSISITFCEAVLFMLRLSEVMMDLSNLQCAVQCSLSAPLCVYWGVNIKYY